jgi:carnitine 3-dehydrogenase
MYTVETHVTHAAEAKALEPLYVLTRVLGADDKRVHLFHALHRGRDGAMIATGEQMYLHVDSRAGKAAPMGPELRDKIERLRAKQAGVAPPREVGRRVAMPTS